MLRDSISHSKQGSQHRCVIKLQDDNWHLTVDTVGDTKIQAFALAIKQLVKCTSLNTKTTPELKA